MPEQFSKAPEAAEIAYDIIPDNHAHLCGVRIEYLFSDAEKENKGRRVLGCASKVSGRNAALARPESEEEPLTFVCNMCTQWRTQAEYRDLEANDGAYSVCIGCLGEYPELGETKVPNKTIKRLEDGIEIAGEMEAAGPPLNRDFFCITIYEPWWKLLDYPRRRAVIDHELCHCGLDDKAQLTLLPHDLEAFNAEVRRHGLWKSDLDAFFRTCQDAQGAFHFDEESASDGSGVASVTISANGAEPVTMTGKQFHDATEAIVRRTRVKS